MEPTVSDFLLAFTDVKPHTTAAGANPVAVVWVRKLSQAAARTSSWAAAAINSGRPLHRLASCARRRSSGDA